jgi:hypothetical protein
MKRDNDLIRLILAAVEKHESTKPFSLSTGMFAKVLPLNSDTLDEHIRLLVEAGFLNAEGHQFGWTILGLTWAGHDFIANAKCQTVWDKAKQVAGHLSFDVFTSILKETALKSVQGLL